MGLVFKFLKSHIVSLLVYLFVMLFVYAAVSKLLDFGTFQMQLAQSPLLGSYATIVSWIVPLLELLIAFLLCLKKLRLIGIIAFYFMMVMFTTYIIIILNFTDFIPCSCGGVLESLGWIEHLIFNFGFLFLSIVAILLMGHQTNFNNKTKNFKRFLVVSLVISTLLGIGIVLGLFIFSEEKIKRNNAFLRRYPPQPLKKIGSYELDYNSYYIAGVHRDTIYLGNTTSALHLAKIDTSLNDINETRVTIDDTDLTFRNLRIRVLDSVLYLHDGTVPILFKGSLNHLNGSTHIKDIAYFSQLQPIGHYQFAIRTLDANTKEHILGIIIKNDSSTLKLKKDLLKKQVDGFFDTDGTLLWNSHLDKLVYVYYYRNQYLVFDTDLELDYQGKTIDTISQAQISLAKHASQNMKQLRSDAILVNGYSHSSNRYLFITSYRLGKQESDVGIKHATIVDVYDLTDGSYAFSFYLFHQNGQKLHNFYVYKDLLITLSGNVLTTYRLDSTYFK